MQSLVNRFKEFRREKKPRSAATHVSTKGESKFNVRKVNYSPGTATIIPSSKLIIPEGHTYNKEDIYMHNTWLFFTCIYNLQNG